VRRALRRRPEPLTDLAQTGDPRVVARIPLPGEATASSSMSRQSGRTSRFEAAASPSSISRLLDPLADQTTTTGLMTSTRWPRRPGAEPDSPNDILMTRARVDPTAHRAHQWGERRVELNVRRQHQVRERSHRFKRARWARSRPRLRSAQRHAVRHAELWSAASTLCADFSVRLTSPAPHCL